MNRKLCCAVVAMWDIAAMIDLFYGYNRLAVFWASLALVVCIALTIADVRAALRAAATSARQGEKA